MKKIIFGIFAHPDDEAFGPCGTLLLEVKAGNDVHLVTLTAGEAGMNPDNHDDLASVRLEEWRAAGVLIGASTMTHFGYKDGELSNIDMIEIGQKLINYISDTVKSIEEPCEIELVSMDLNGITGHIDHIVAGRASCYAFYRLQQTDPRVKRIRLACVPSEQLENPNTNWLFMDAGRKAGEIGEIVDARPDQDKIIEIMKCHRTQRSDFESHIKNGTEHIGLNYFIILS